MAKLSGEQSCGSAVNVAAKVGVELVDCTRSWDSNNVTLKFKAYVYCTDQYTKNSIAIYVNGEEYTVFNSNSGANQTTVDKKYKTSTITLTLSCSGSSTTFKVGVNGTTWNPSSAKTNFTFTLSSAPAKKYKITYNANGGTWSGAAYTTKTKGTDVKLSTTKPTKTGFTFKGWGLSTSDTSVDYAAGATYTKDASDTLYAIWSENYVNIKYYSNYATSYNGTDTVKNTPAGTNVLLKEQKYYYNNSYSSGLNNYDSKNTLGMLRTGYTNLKKWGTTTSGGTTIGQDTAFTGQELAEKLGKSLKADGSSFSDNLYAQWSAIDYTLKINPNGGYRVSDNSTATTSATYNYKDTATVTKRARTGYELTGYKLTATSDGSTSVCGAKITLNSDKTASYTQGYCNVTATAQWRILTNDIEYKANGGTFSSSFATTQTKNYGATATIKAFSGTTPGGSKFKEWNTEPDGSGTSYAAGASYSKNADLTLYAIYTLNTYKITYNANGGTFSTAFNNKNPQSKTHGVTVNIYNFDGTVKSGNKFAGWNTKANGSGTAYAAGAAYKTNANLTLYAQWATSFSKVGVPTNLTVTDNGDNTFTVSCKTGASGTNNKTSGVAVLVTIDGTTPTTLVSTHKFDIAGGPSTTVSETIDLTGFANCVMYTFFGADAIGPVKFRARTEGAAGSSYYSAWTDVVSGNVTFHTKMWEPKIISPRKSGETIGTLSSYKFSWGTPTTGTIVNNSIAGYNYRVYDETSGTNVAIGTTTNLYYTLPANKLTAGHTYRLYVQTISSLAGMNSIEAESGRLTVKNIIPFDPVIPTFSSAAQLPTTMHNSEELFINTGEGNVVKITWPASVAENNEVKDYTVYITDSQTGLVYSNKNTRENVAYISATMVQDAMDDAARSGDITFSVDIRANSVYGAYYGSSLENTFTVRCTEACTGTYVEDTNSDETIRKRAIALVKVSEASGDSWKLATKCYSRDPHDAWALSDIRYEALFDERNEIFVDENDEPIYIY